MTVRINRADYDTVVGTVSPHRVAQGCRNLIALSVLSALLIGGCSRTDRDILALQTRDGISLRALVNDSSRRVVLLLDPAHCFTCYRGLVAWEAWAEKNGERIAVLLTRDPNQTERKGMLLAGVRETGVLAPTTELETPIQIVVTPNAPLRVVYSATDQEAFSMIKLMDENR